MHNKLIFFILSLYNSYILNSPSKYSHEEIVNWNVFHHYFKYPLLSKIKATLNLDIHQNRNNTTMCSI